MKFYYFLSKSCFLEDDTNGHQNENQNSNQDSEQVVDKEENKCEKGQNFGRYPNKNDNNVQENKKPQKEHSKNNSKKGDEHALRVKSITAADVINNNNDSQKALLEVKIKIYPNKRLMMLVKISSKL